MRQSLLTLWEAESNNLAVLLSHLHGIGQHDQEWVISVMLKKWNKTPNHRNNGALCIGLRYVLDMTWHDIDVDCKT